MDKKKLMFIIGCINIITIIFVFVFPIRSYTSEIDGNSYGFYIYEIASNLDVLFTFAVAAVIILIGLYFIVFYDHHNSEKKINLVSILFLVSFGILLYSAIYYYNEGFSRDYPASTISFKKQFAYYSIIISCSLSLLNCIIPYIKSNKLFK